MLVIFQGERDGGGGGFCLASEVRVRVTRRVKSMERRHENIVADCESTLDEVSKLHGVITRRNY